MKNEHDVVIVGAGPVGLWLACELRLAGVDVALLDRRDEPARQSRALTIHGRTLEVFALRGLEARFLASGRPIPTGHYGVLDTRLDFSPFRSRYPFTLFIPQATTEAMLEERARELGVDIMRGWTAESIDDTGADVIVSAEGKEGRIRLAASYVVGADGARSIVRRETGIPFEGYPATQTLVLGDVVLGELLPRPVISSVNARGCAMIAPLGDGIHHRIVLLDPDRSAVAQNEPLTLGELQASTRKILGSDFGAADAIWLSRFTDETRLARTYRKGRVLLAGDAAHIHMPAGGQGMNVGIQDAMNLGWKLAAVVKGSAPESLLDSYEGERRPVGERLYANTLSQTALVSAFGPSGQALRATMETLLKIPAVNRFLAGELSGFDVAYDEAAGYGGADGRLRPGSRVPDIDLTTKEGELAGLHSFLTDGKWLSLSLADGAVAPRPDWLGDRDVRGLRASAKDELFTGYSALLVRPDGYLASAT
ncbi:FAD-dependent oxidoreductase [Mesorhizobium sp. L-8-3]|uniref:FAD-dependent oxidoreductase n=1 Tax=Mesorhizobium sp. L-8-3 TaxID=2744522 RepID=UPI001928CF1D|nr:FAD-dependent oxidoreductase [Mesorhizobium sp. L-8-3]BCH24163.1 putative aromatic compound monooxygenase YhjG [Mesorhizobium sp. L-8-3]